MAERPNILLQFDHLSRPVRFIGGAEILDALPDAVAGWPYRRLDGAFEGACAITIEGRAGRYISHTLRSAEPNPSDDAVDALTDFVADLSDAYLDDHTGVLQIHCAALEFEQGLVLFPQKRRMGKSVLALALAALGYRLFCDDVLALAADQDPGIALGISPRLRLPIPQKGTVRLGEFLAARPLRANARYGFVRLAAAELAAHGARRPIVGIVQFQRNEAGAATLETIPASDALALMIERCSAGEVRAGEVFSRLHRIVAAARCFKLRYADLDDIAIPLAAAFGPPGGERA